MPKNRNSGGNKQRFKQISSLGQKLSDVTLNDFANSTGRGGRLKKSATNSIVKEVKEICNGAESDLAWYDKDLDDFTIDFEPTLEDQENCDNAILPKSQKQKKAASKCNANVDDDKGIEYPLDVWFLISEFVKPEDVGTFSSICQGTLYVVNTPKFWFSLYKRYYNSEIKLPQRLRPECMERPHSLKACVIRSLFHLYPPFIERVRSLAPFDSEPHDLTTRVCMLMWHRKHRTAWDFFFKFHKGLRFDSDQLEQNAKRPDLLDMLGDVHANLEKGCKVLQVTCLNFVSTPAVMGMYLVAVSLNVGHKMHHHKLKLTFSTNSYRHSMRNQDAGNITMTFDPVSNIRVLNWWHPQYPYNEVV